MKLPELKALVDEWMSTGDWNESEVVLYDRDGNHISADIELSFECGTKLDTLTVVEA